MNNHLLYLWCHTFIAPLKKLQWGRPADRLVRFYGSRLLFAIWLILCGIVVSGDTWFTFAFLARVGWRLRGWAYLVADYWGWPNRRSQILSVVNKVNIFPFKLFVMRVWTDFRRVCNRVLLSKRYCFVLLAKVFTFLVFSFDEGYYGLKEKHFGFWHSSLEKIFYFQLGIISKKILQHNEHRFQELVVSQILKLIALPNEICYLSAIHEHHKVNQRQISLCLPLYKSVRIIKR